MSTKSLTLTVPVSLAQELETASQEFLAEVLERYARGEISFGAAAHQADVAQSELARHAYARGMEPPFSAEMLAEELSTVSILSNTKPLMMN